MSDTPGTDIIQWVDDAMYEAQPMLKEEGARITPRVFLLSATPDPLGNLAADMRMYRGDPVYDLSEITDEQRRWAWNELSKTILNTPYEGVQVKFMIEAVTRSFTHQMVRQRVGTYYVQESLRFAVKRGLAQETALPPSISRTDEGPGKIWVDLVDKIAEVYNQLVDAGIPAEDARGLLPHATTTRIIYTTNLRALFGEAGKRLCTQAQFEWRAVFMGFMKAMREYSSDGSELGLDPDSHPYRVHGDAWQWQLIATPTPMTFAPVCYKTGKCEFMASLDRGCTIRNRVMAFHENGVPPQEWSGIGKPRAVLTREGHALEPINPEEWMSNPWAGITTEDNQRPPE